MFHRHSVGSYEKSCRGMSFVSADNFLMSQKLKYRVKNAKQTRYWLFAFLFSRFLQIIHDFRRLFPKILWIQPESATRRGSRAISITVLLSFLVSMHAIYFRALRVRAAIAFKWSPRLCGYPVNSRTLETVIQQLLRLFRDSGWGKWV